MHAWIRRALCAVGLTGGLVLLGFGLAEAASADGNGPVTTGESAILSGNQTGIDGETPINLSGNQVTVIGEQNTTQSTDGSSTGSSSGGTSSGPTTSGQGGAGSGNQTPVGVQAPVEASDNQVTVLGQDSTVAPPSGSAGGGSTGGGTPGDGAADGPATGGVNSPATGGGAAAGPQAGSSAVAGVLPNTGASAALTGAGLAGLLLLLAGAILSRRGVAVRSVR